MNKRVLFIQNGEFDGPGLFASTLGKCGVELATVHPWHGDPVPTSLDGWSGVAIGGGSMSAYETEQFPFLQEERALVKNARAARVPLLGMCLGAQIMAAAFGGEVFRHHTKEIGFFDVTFTPAGQNDPLWKDQPTSFQPVHWHGDTFSLPPDATLLASSALTPNQLFRVDDRFYGFQFHLEIDLPVLSAMVTTDDGYLPLNGVDPAAFLRTAERALPTVEPIGRTVFTRWAKLLI